MRRRAFLGGGAGLGAGLGIGAGALSLGGCGAPHVIDGGFTGIDMARGHALRDAAPGGGAPSVARRARVVIAGGGVAGLAAARALRQRGIDDFVLLELEDEPGGNSRGGTVGGLPCPLGAHYLPVPGDDAIEVQDLLEELGLRRRVAGRWQYDERHLCHSPQERLFFQGEWQEGLLPLQGVGASTLAQYRAFSRRVDALRPLGFAIPAFRASASADESALLALDAIDFERWLGQEGFDDPHLRWYLDYCCRDDYGAGIAHVSARAGLHYFASRHGFHVGAVEGHAPGDGAAQDAVLTWPEGNAWLARRLAAPLGERLRTGHVVARIAPSRDGVEVDAFDAASRSTVRWRADHCIVALPVFIAARVVENAPEVLRRAARHVRHAPWLVANVHLSAPLADRPGAAPSWDNVIHGTRGLGYVDAGHQRLDPTPRATVLSWYRPLGPGCVDAAGSASGTSGGGVEGTPGADGRRLLVDRAWSAWRDEMLGELSLAHPDIATLATRVDITRYGHAMAMPSPGLLRHLGAEGRIAEGRLSFAHADWSGYSIFEEAFTRGHLAGRAAGA